MDDRLSKENQVDTLLVVRCQLGERAAFDALISRWTLPLHRYAFKLAQDRDVADDLVQDVWLRVLRGLGRLREPERFRPWLFGIAHRTFADRLRIQYRLPIDPHTALDTLPALDGGALQIDREQLVHDGLDALPVIEREVLTLFYLEELQLTEIAVVLDVPLGTVKSRLHRARQLFRNHLTEKDKLP